MKNIINTFFLIILLTASCFALTLDEIETPKDLMGKISNSDKPESVQKEVIKQVNNIKKEDDVETKLKEDKAKTASNEIQKETESFGSTYADLSLKKLADDISYELEEDEQKVSSDLAILWQATTERSETMKYTIYKLSNPDEDKPNDSVIKKILKPIANFSSLAGASVSGNPYMATGALIGGGLVNAFMRDDKELNYKFSKISDADMVLLVRKIDSLQKKLIDLYVDYKTKEELANIERENFEKREKIYLAAQNSSKEELIIADVNYRNSKIRLQKAQDEFETSRAILENLVGKDAINQISQ